MATCEICGTDFDEFSVQIVVPGILKSFDRVECAARGRALFGASAAPLARQRAVFADVSRSPAPQFDLRGFPAGLAAALSGGRVRLALGGASAAVAMIVAATAYLSLRGPGAAGESDASLLLPPPVRDGGVDRVNPRVLDARTAQAGGDAEPATQAEPAAEPLPVPEQDTAVFTVALQTPTSAVPEEGAEQSVLRLAVYRSEPTAYVLRIRRKHSEAAATKVKHRRDTRPPGRSGRPHHVHTKKSHSAATRPGWGHGDSNHRHLGPPKGSRAKASARAQGWHQ